MEYMRGISYKIQTLILVKANPTRISLSYLKQAEQSTCRDKATMRIFIEGKVHNSYSHVCNRSLGNIPTQDPL